MQSTGATATAAERPRKAWLVERSELQPADTKLTPDSLFADLAAYSLADIDMEGHISRTTRNLYERNMRTLVSPAFDSLTLREMGVARCDRFIKELGKRSYNRAKQARVVLRLALELAVRHKVLVRNPMDHVSRLRREPHIPDALTAPEANVIRAAIAAGKAAPITSPARCPTASPERPSRSCSAHRPGSARCSPSAAGTSTSQAP